MKRLSAVLLALTIVFSFAGCVNENSDDSHDAMLIGIWKSEKTDSPQAVGWTMEFKENGELSIYPSDEQIDEFAEKMINENIKQSGSLEKVLEDSGFKTKEELKTKYTEAAKAEFKRTDLYWKTQDGSLKKYNTKEDYDNNKDDENLTNTYKISEDGKMLTIYAGEDVLEKYVKA